MKTGSGERSEPGRFPLRSRISFAAAYLSVIFGCVKIDEFTMSGSLTGGIGVLTCCCTSTA
jgi:hypothetical protein